MKTFHIGGFHPLRRYKTLEAALAEARDDDTIELHKNISFAGKVNHNIIIKGNGHTLTVENGSIGLDCREPVVIQDLHIRSGPRANGLMLQRGGRLEHVTTSIQGPCRVMYPTIIGKFGRIVLQECKLMKALFEKNTSVYGEDTLFEDYYGGICHIGNHENLSVFKGNNQFSYCTFHCCLFQGVSHMLQCTFGVFNHNHGILTMDHCRLNPTVNHPDMDLGKEPEDGPLRTKDMDSRFSLENRNGDLYIRDYASCIPEEFVGFYVLSGNIEIKNTTNADIKGYHIIRNSSLTFQDTIDAAYYELSQSTISCIRSKANTSMKTKTAMEELEELIGLGNVKSQLKSILNTIAMNRKANKDGFEFSYHMVFAGDPGTGKTTVAKLAAQALFEIGAIPKNKCTEVAADSLVKGFVGQTAEHVRNVLDDALGGVLFIDEAYQLTVKEGQNSFNSDVLSVLIRYMEEHRKDLIVIAAGYEKEMKEFLASNIGLSRRFQWITFEDYTPEEMAQIFESMRESYQEEYASRTSAAMIPRLFERLTSLYRQYPDCNGRVTNGGNGGLVRNVFQRVIQARNDRVMSGEGPDTRITENDILAGFRKEMEKAKKTGSIFGQ